MNRLMNRLSLLKRKHRLTFISITSIYGWLSFETFLMRSVWQSVEHSDGQVMPPYNVFSSIWSVDNALTNLEFDLRLKLVTTYEFIWPHSQTLNSGAQVTDSYHFPLLWPTICCLLFWWHVWHQRRLLYCCQCLA